MIYARLTPLLLLAGCFPSSGQSVRSTHSGLVYYFDGYVFVGDDQLQQKFGRFPEIAEGSVLRTELGRAEILLTPGVFLRVAENSAVRVVSNSLTDTRVELLRGSAIIEASREAGDPHDTIIYRDWKMRVPKESVARIDADPAQLRVFSGTAEVSTDGTSDVVTVRRGEILPLASVLLTESVPTPASDPFNNWAMNRSSAVSEDNTIAAGITDDPDQIDSSGAALGNFSYFPPTGIPSLGMNTPYGLSFWSPGLSPYAFQYPAYPYGYGYGLWGGPGYVPLRGGTYIYPGSFRPGSLRTPPLGGSIVRPPGIMAPRPSYAPPPRPAVTAPPRSAAPHAIRR